ncbi:MAG: hypothetical protein JXR59_08740 [Desulfuromonadaceae bacterium]|nr:hypothetical protein [Desulfuromonadaceae bacterium]
MTAAQPKPFPAQVLADLLELMRIDTLCQDLYLDRARELLSPILSLDGYRSLKTTRVQMASQPNQIRNAMLHNDWNAVRELSDAYDQAQKRLEAMREAEEYARSIYDRVEPSIDPFSPGMHNLAGVPMDRLKGLQQDALAKLSRLGQTDQARQSWYGQRHAALTALDVQDNILDSSSRAVPEAVLEENAAQALEEGNMARLEQLAEKILATKNHDPAATTPEELFSSTHSPPEDYRFAFAPEVVKRATALGLSAYAVPSQAAEYAPFARFAWHPTFSQTPNSHQANVVQVPDIPFPQDFPQPLKDRIQLFAIHPFINSAGVRYLPTMVAENVLVEDFAEPTDGEVLAVSGLLQALGLTQRRQLSRDAIEAALLERGSRVLRQELGLDPDQFKIVCIPPDLHLRIGQQLGWGQQKIWTHFDGYMIMADASRRALVGGDVRYGGIYDLLGVSGSYDSERIITRLAVVQRRRLAIRA